MRQWFFIIEKGVYDNEPDSLWHEFWFLGEKEFIDSCTVKISYENIGLNYYTDYVIVAQNIKMIDSTDTLTAPTKTSDIKTVLPVQHIVSTSFEDSDLVHCGDTLYFDFNRKLNSLNTSLGKIVELVKQTDTTNIDSSRFIYQTESLYANYWFNDDSTRIYAKPGYNLSEDTVYVAKVNLGYLTGDSSDNFHYHFSIPSMFKINLMPITLDTADTIPSDFYFYPVKKGYAYVDLGDSLTIITDKYTDNQKFKEWICNEDPTIDHSTSRTITVTKNCLNICDLNVYAVYEEIPKDTLIVDQYEKSSCTISVYDRFDNYLGSSGTYTVYEENGDFLSVVADTDEDYSFKWSSDMQNYNGCFGSDVNVMGNLIGGTGHIDPDPDYDPEGYSLSITVSFPNTTSNLAKSSFYDNTHEIEDVISVMPDPSLGIVKQRWMSNKWEFDQKPDPIDINAVITHNDCGCYMISRFKGVSNGFKHTPCTTYDDNGITRYGPYYTNYSSTVDFDNKAHHNVVIHVDRKLIQIDAEIKVKNDGILVDDESSARLEFLPKPLLDPSHCQYVPKHLQYPYRGDHKESYKLLYKCKTSVNIETIYDKYIYEFDKFNDEESYYSNTDESYMNLNIQCEHYTLDNDKKIQALLERDFRLMYIYICSNPDDKSQFVQYKATHMDMAQFARSSFDVDPEKYVYLYPDETDGDIVKMKFEFSHDVDKSTVNDKTSLCIEETSAGVLPNHLLHKYFPKSYSREWIDNKTLLLKFKTLVNSNLQIYHNIRKLQDFKIKFTNDILNTSSAALQNPNEFLAVTELPKVHINLEWVKMTDNGESEILMFYLIPYKHNEDITWYKGSAPEAPYLFIFEENRWAKCYSCDWESPNLEGDPYLCKNIQLQSVKDEISLGILFYDINSGDIKDNRGNILDGAIDYFYYTPDDWDDLAETTNSTHHKNMGNKLRQDPSRFWNYIADLISVKATEYDDAPRFWEGSGWADDDEKMGGTIGCDKCYESGECPAGGWSLNVGNWWKTHYGYYNLIYINELNINGNPNVFTKCAYYISFNLY